jgi:hypothetical protein
VLSPRELNSLPRELSKVAEPYIKQEDEGKFRCKTCQKLFKATPFVEKHIANKHPELVKSLDDVCAIARSSHLADIFALAPVLQQLCP